MQKYLLLIIVIFLLGCSSKDNTNISSEETSTQSPEQSYMLAKQLFDQNNYDLANEKFKEIKQLYPLSNEAIQSEIMIGFTFYLKMDYENAVLYFEKIIKRYPSHKNLDYVYYMKAISNYEQITHHGLDGKYNELALSDFNQVIKRFPNSEYAKDSRQKIILIKSNKAAKHMSIGRFYSKEKKYTAALNRFKIVVDEYSMTRFTPEALFRIVEIYHHIGMINESRNTASVLGHNYPNSKWYKYSYDLINKNNKNKTIMKKVSNLFNK